MIAKASPSTKLGLLPTPPMPPNLPKANLTENGRKVLTKRYLRRGPDGEPIETIEEMFWRVAWHVAKVEEKWAGNPEQRAIEFYHLLISKKFFPNSPTFTGAGTPLGQLAACFVLPINDDMGRDSAGIFQTLRDAALIQQTGGGNGFSFSRLRPKGALVKSSAGQATGPVGFLRVYDHAFGEIAQGGTRRGANMAVLRVDHPDIEEFITCKTDENQITNFNISVGITDAFMRAVQNDEEWELRFPDVTAPEYSGWNGTLEEAEKAGIPIRVYKKVRARKLFDKIVKQAHHNGEPGVLFLDAANRSNPVPHLYQLESTNPCVTGETLIYTDRGLRRADALAAEGKPVRVVTDSRFGTETFMQATHVFQTGVKPVYRLLTREGYELRLTEDHQVMTPSGWVKASQLRPGDRVYLLNRKGGFGTTGTHEEGQVLGWLVGDGTVNVVRAVLSFFGDEKRELAPAFANMVTNIVEKPRQARSYPVGVGEIESRNEARAASDRLRAFAEQHGLVDNKYHVPETVFTGSESMQRGFLQALFTADGSVHDGGAKGCSVRLSSSHLNLLKDVQRLLLNFGIVSKIYENRRPAGYRLMPDGKGGTREYFHKAQHELVISKSSLVVFAHEIGFMTETKNARLADYLARSVHGPYQESFLATVLAVEPDGIEAVYDLHQPETHSFVANGIVVHNCGEQWLGPYENCCLGSINLNEHRGPNGTVDWETLRQSIVTATRFLDDVVEANAYVPAVPQLKEAAHRARRIGLGIMGLADLMYHVGVRYGAPEGQEFASVVMEFIRYHAMLTSIELARERGPFPAIEGSIYDPNNLKWHPPQSIVPITQTWGRPPVDWDQVVQGIKRYGIRNAAQTTIAPTGTIATVAGCEGYGCEPVFALAYIRHVNDNGKDLQLTYGSPLFEKALTEAGIDPETRQKIFEEVMRVGSCQNIAAVPEHIRHVFVTAGDVTAEEHVRMQAALQAFVDNSISKCVTGDTLVLTGNGLVPIASLSDLRLPEAFEGLNLNVVSPQGMEKSDAFYYGGWRETRIVRLSFGFQIEGTPNHRVHVLDENGQITFRRLDDLRIGDTVVLYGGQQVFGSPGQPLPPYQGEQRTSAKEVHFPERMSAELAYLLGCITSEGSISVNGVQICNNDRHLLENLAVSFRNLFNLESHIVRDLRRESLYSLQVNSRALRNWLLTSLNMEAGAHNKIIPDCILRASREEIIAFLRGLFLDAFVTWNGRLFEITMASERLVRQLQVLLLNFGIFATLRQTGEHAWSLTVQGESLEKLSWIVEFDEVWKNQRIRAYGENRAHRMFNYGALLPERVTPELRVMQKNTAHSLRSLYGQQTMEYQRARVNLLQGYRLDRSLGNKLYEHFSDAATPFARRFFESDREGIFYVTVQGVESGFAEVFDISVPGSHAFIANGLCNHNTINFPEGATVEDVATAYLLAWELGCKGITVYVTGSREKVVLETLATANKKESASQLTLWHDPKKPRPRVLPGRTYRTETPLGKAFVTINENGDGQPFEVFINTAKAGSETAAVSEAIGRLISYILRLASPIAPLERLREIVRQLSGIGGGRSLGFGPNRVRSLPDGIGQVLDDYLREKEGFASTTAGQNGNNNPHAEQAAALPLQIGDLCPECGEAAVVNEEGCRKCYACGYSEC